MSLGIIIQARSQSTRFQNKIILPFSGDRCILEIITRRLIEAFPHIPVIVASTLDPKDDKIEEIINEIPSSKIFRGDEKNVLKRFIEASEYFKLSSFIRVCSDNVFIDTGYMSILLNESRNTNADYLSFMLAGNIPTIRSHHGLMAEWVTLKALKRVASLTSDKLFLEHVTNFIYTHADNFKINLIKAPSFIFSETAIRLTIDTEADFRNAQKVYSELIVKGLEVNTNNILNIVKSNPGLLESMKEQIKLNSK